MSTRKAAEQKKSAMLQAFANASGRKPTTFKGGGGVEYAWAKEASKEQLRQLEAERMKDQIADEKRMQGRAMIDEQRAAEAAARPRNHILHRGR